MKVLIVGSDMVGAIEHHYCKYLSQAGIKINQFPAQTLFYKFYYKSILNKILFRMGISPILKKINRKFKRSVEQFRPNVILVFKGMEIQPKSLKWAKKRGIKLANYNPDNPFIFTGRGSGNAHVTNSIKLYDLHFTYNMSIKEELETKHNKRTALLPFGFDISEELYNACIAQEEIVKACFLGNPDSQRAHFITQLAEKGVALDVYGNGWERFVNHPKISLFKSVYDDSFWKTLRKYRVQLNLMRIHNINSHNMRSFEIPGIGGIMVAPKTTEHQLYFKDQEDVFLFSNIDECAKIINHLLSLSNPEADAIRKIAATESRKKEYGYADRSTIVKEELLILLKQ
jgi:hypothetical protein